MKRFRAITIVLVISAALVPGIGALDRATAQPSSGLGPRAAGVNQPQLEGRYFDTDFHPAHGQSTLVAGCLYNRAAIPFDRVSLSVEGVDEKGAVVGSSGASLGTIPAGSYGHFEFPRMAGAAKYRAKVVSFEWMQR